MAQYGEFKFIEQNISIKRAVTRYIDDKGNGN